MNLKNKSIIQSSQKLMKYLNNPYDNLPNLNFVFSISNTLAKTFEQSLLFKMKFSSKTLENQFGYKKTTSCSHGLFIFKETIMQ